MPSTILNTGINIRKIFSLKTQRQNIRKFTEDKRYEIVKVVKF